MSNTLNLFPWQCHPKAEQFTKHLLEQAVAQSSFIAQLEQELQDQTNTRLFDWVDHFVVGYSADLEIKLQELGYVIEAVHADYRVFHHPGAKLARIIVKDKGAPLQGVAVLAEDIAHFLMVRGIGSQIEGSILSEYRRCCVSTEEGVSLWIVERRASTGIEPIYHNDTYQARYLQAVEIWETRPRDMEDDDEAMMHTLSLGRRLVELVGQDLAAWIILFVERQYWQARNTAAQVQKDRQDRLGMGWANHDHHTFRSSRPTSFN